MCYMTEEQVGVRQLRQNLSVYLRRVKDGETLTVTERGQPVARLTPLPERSSGLARLIAEGKVIPAQGDLLDLPPPSGPVTDDVSRALQEEREDRFL